MAIVDAAVKKMMSALPEFSKAQSDPREGLGIRLDDYADIIEEMGLTVEQVLAEERDVLGTYRPMRSPGLITLYSNELSAFFWHLAYQINKTGYYMERIDFERMAHMVALKTYAHEQFHHFSDVARQLFGGTYDHQIEEALAVAWSYRKVQEQRNAWMSKEARLSSPFYNEMMQQMYRYTSLGYRDWVYYQAEVDFLTTVAIYLGGTQRGFLAQSGIDVGRVLLAVLEEVQDKGVIEEIV